MLQTQYEPYRDYFLSVVPSSEIREKKIYKSPLLCVFEDISITATPNTFLMNLISACVRQSENEIIERFIDALATSWSIYKGYVLPVSSSSYDMLPLYRYQL